ncbi:MAG: hypothetical protein ACI9HB_001385, partial [Gammaproteobacteria bacterium]
RDPYLALLPAGLAMPSVLPHPRWALTPPFHRYLHIEGSLFSVALSLGLPPLGITQHRAFHGVRTFLEVLPPRDHPTTRICQLRAGRVCVNGESVCQISKQSHVSR